MESVNERVPLHDLVCVGRKGVTQCKGLGWNVGGTTLEGLGDCASQRIPAEIESPGQKPDVEEVLHAAVGLPESHHSMELLSDDALPWVAAQARAREIQDDWVAHRLGRQSDSIAETDV